MNEEEDKSKRDARGRYAEGTGGKPKGATNKFTDLKQAFFNVFNKIEEESKKNDKINSFYDWATKSEGNQRVFYQMISKMLPSSVSLEGNIPVTFEVSEKFMPKIKDPAPKPHEEGIETEEEIAIEKEEEKVDAE